MGSKGIVAVGSPAPDFELDGIVLSGGDVARRRYRLSAQRSGPLVLAFYPGDDTLVCTRQMCSYSTSLSAFTDLGAEVWGISTQDLASHESFARKHDLRLPLLADVDKTVVRSYGVARMGGLHVARSVFVVDSAGVLRWQHVSNLGLGYQDVATLQGVLQGLAA